MSPLPPDFEARKQAARLRSARNMVLKRLREHGIDPYSFAHRFLSADEEARFLDAVGPTHRIDCTFVEKVPDWAAVTERIAGWARGRSEVAIWYDADPGNGGIVLPGVVLAEHLDAIVSAVKQHGNVMLATPDGRAGCVYFEEEYDNDFAAWDNGQGSSS